jgi:hypothetical protein
MSIITDLTDPFQLTGLNIMCLTRSWRIPDFRHLDMMGFLSENSSGEKSVIHTFIFPGIE